MEEHLDIQDKTCALLQQQQPQQLDDDGHLLDSGPPITCDKSVATLATAYASIYASDTNLMAPDISLRGRMSRMFCTHRFQVTIVSLVILDCIIVIAELLMDLRLLNLDEQQTSRSTKADYVVPDVLHCINIAILSMFCAECLIKVFAFGLSFLRHGWEIFDTTVVAATFALDVASQHSHTATTGFGLLIILRLWRVARILNGVVASVKTQSDRRLECEKRRRQTLEDELCRWHQISESQRDTITQLRNLVQASGIALPTHLM